MKHSGYWVVFSGQTEHKILKLLLKKGYRHCFVLINDGINWFSFDPLSHCSEIIIHHHIDPDFNLCEWVENSGCEVIKYSPEPIISKPYFPMICTCVESVKRVLRIRKLSIVTPYGLRNYLLKQNAHNQPIKGELKNG